MKRFVSLGALPGATSATTILGRALRAPVLHFVLLGAILCAAVPWVRRPTETDRAADRKPIVLTAGDVERARREWTQQHGAPPNEKEEEALVNDVIDRELLLREALSLRFQDGDGAVRTRLVQVARFLGLAPADDERGLEREARGLGLDHTDLVIRRHLVEMMRLAMRKLPPAALPSEAEMRRYYEEHTELFTEPARIRFTHVYLSPQRRGANLESDAERLLSALRRGVPPEEADRFGDPFMRGAHVASSSEAQIERTFGPELARALESVPARTWSGPLRSRYGPHLVWVHERVPARQSPFETVRSQVLQRLARERGDQRLRAGLRLLRQRYDVEIETSPAGRG